MGTFGRLLLFCIVTTLLSGYLGAAEAGSPSTEDELDVIEATHLAVRRAANALVVQSDPLAALRYSNQTCARLEPKESARVRTGEAFTPVPTAPSGTEKKKKGT